MDNFPFYADFLVTVFNWMFQTLTKQGVEFYKWYFSTHRPHEQLYSSSDLRAMAGSLADLLKDNKIEELAEWLQHQQISDAVGVMDAIQRQIELAQLKPHKLPGCPDGCVYSVQSCLLSLADHIDQRNSKST